MLELEGVHAGYGPVPILFGVNLRVEAGEVVALMGRNGMGKTTTMRTIFGVLPATSGRMTFNGQSLVGMPIHRVARLGLGIVPEGRGIFIKLSVRENLIATARPGPWTLRRVLQLFPRLDERANNLGSQLSGGEQQMLAVGRALLTNPKLLILDEATEGLAPTVRAQIWDALSLIKREGQSILVVDKFLAPLTRIADRFYMMEKGVAAWTGTSADVVTQHETVARYLSV
jgi:branched-chain amino acid transport system ATP-binding protein